MVSGVTGNVRLILSALVERLIYADEATFKREDALELAELLPTPRGLSVLSRLLPRLKVKGRLPGASAAGFAAGVGNVSAEGDQISFDVDSRGRQIVRAGQWKLHRDGKAIEIEQVMTDDGDEGRTARLEFVHGQPARMMLLNKREISVGPLVMSSGHFISWKLPA